MQNLQSIVTKQLPCVVQRISMKTLCIFVCLFFSLVACKTKNLGTAQEQPGSELTERCMMKYDPGPCRGAYTRYYYDQKAGKCMSFIYGGCQGVVPFETLEDCRVACER